MTLIFGDAMKHLSLLLCSTLLLAGCQGGGSDDTDIDVGNGDIGSPETPGSAEGGDWTRGFVESFDPAKVEAVRNLAGYVANNMRYTLRIDDHPVYSEGQSVDSNALLGARVDYAHSTGLTGAGQIVAMVDDGIRATHEQFSGKTVTEMGLDGARPSTARPWPR